MRRAGIGLLGVLCVCLTAQAEQLDWTFTSIPKPVEAIVARPVAKAAPVPIVVQVPVVRKAEPVRVQQRTALPANWHSHTCSAGHTWSHRNGDPNASHRCPVCGRVQFTQDPR